MLLRAAFLSASHYQDDMTLSSDAALLFYLHHDTAAPRLQCSIDRSFLQIVALLIYVSGCTPQRLVELEERCQSTAFLQGQLSILT